jgi:hypothetical protein
MLKCLQKVRIQKMQHGCKYRGYAQKNGMRGGDYLLCGSTRSIMGDKFTSPLQLQLQLQLKI